MEKTTTIKPEIENRDRIQEVQIVDEMQKAYLDYAMSVIVSRALPDARDGLKPVQRRIIYAAYEIGALPTSKYQKCAKIVGEVLAKYHPHDNVSVYDAMVRMAQKFSMRYTLIDGQGNFGSIDGDSAAAMRYTEAKLSKISLELLRNINEETVNYMDNYSAEYKEPTLLPSVIPNLLLNGAQGIAVGMATSIPPHNLSELIDGIISLIEKYEPSTNYIALPKARKPFESQKETQQRINQIVERHIPIFNSTATVEDLFKHVRGPDFPTGATIYNKADIIQTYATGRGRVTIRATTEIEEIKNGKHNILVTELPFQVNKARLVSKIADLVKQKKVEGITDLRDESDRNGIRVVIELRNTARPQKILNYLFKHTELQLNFNSNFVALVNNEPRVMTLKNILEEFVKHRQHVIIRRGEYNLARLQEREHILYGLKIALDHIDEVIATIRSSKDTETAKLNLIKKFELTTMQAEAILDMQLRRLARLEREKIENELKEVLKSIEEIKSTISNPEKILAVIKQELNEIKEKYGDKRKTKIIAGKIGTFSEEDLIVEEENVITFTKTGYIKRLKADIYIKQSRGGKGVKGMTTKEADEITKVAHVNTHDELLFFTNLGRVYKKRAWEIAETGRAAKGSNIVNFLDLKEGEKLSEICAITFKKEKEHKYVLFVTELGQVKKTSIDEFENIRQNGIIAINLKNNDRLSNVSLTTGNCDILITTQKGKAIRFSEKDVRKMGRSAGGVIGIKLNKDDKVIKSRVFDSNAEKLYNLTVSEKGFGKKTSINSFNRQNRGGKGLITAKITSRTGNLVDSVIVENKGDVLLTSAEGQVIRLAINKVPTISRTTQGVILIRTKKSTDHLSSVVVITE